ncbi:MAG: hypothetical protein QOF01_2255 [Thermomicrobiales bacterium]|jgi:hypothetical protein|nr:hypothetical protein [Thermomicrobiales bacterium]
MVATRKPITVSDESNLTELLDEAAVEPVLLEKDGVLYRLSRADEVADIWAGYDPERVRAGLSAMSGIITAEEAERMKALVYRGREEGTRPPDRP